MGTEKCCGSDNKFQTFCVTVCVCAICGFFSFFLRGCTEQTTYNEYYIRNEIQATYNKCLNASSKTILVTERVYDKVLDPEKAKSCQDSYNEQIKNLPTKP